MAHHSDTEQSTAAETDAILETVDLTKQFGELVAVDGVNIAVADGEFRSIIGPNGAGKTTLFNLITGTLEPSSGSVYLDGEDVTDRDPAEQVRLGLGRSFQITNVFNGLTVRENVRLAAQSMALEDLSFRQRMTGDPARLETINAETSEVLDRVGLLDQEAATASSLAHGDRRRLELGLVLATDPSVVLLDEPTAGMSDDETEAAIDLIEDVLAERTLLLVEHDVDLVMRISDRITVLHRGRVIADDSPSAIADDDAVQEAYLGGYE